MTDKKTFCSAKHTDYQPAEANWRCPKCNTGITDRHEGMVIQESPDDADSNCVKLHPGDDVQCMNCRSSWSGAALARVLKKRDHVMTCPTCKGAGVVPEVRA